MGYFLNKTKMDLFIIIFRAIYFDEWEFAAKKMFLSKIYSLQILWNTKQRKMKEFNLKTTKLNDKIYN